MDVSLILKIGIIGISVAVLHQILSRSGRDEYAMLSALAGVLVILMMLLPEVVDLLSILKRIMDF
ncbi:MAG TPA: stage III sporulation protein AC [Ruminococcaceae bacterium]|nr:stage III sporulation protein AC [Oscillospiraceae bacterium]